jgi:hypothetical protein
MDEQREERTGEPATRKRRGFFVPALIGGALLSAGGYVAVRQGLPGYFADSAVYDVVFDAPEGWQAQPKSAMTLFLYKHPERAVFIRGSANNVIAENAISPELDTEGLARYYLATTEENQEDWRGERLPNCTGGPVEFSVIRRWRSGKTVYNAFARKGNTTLMVGLYAADEEAKLLGEFEGEFRTYLEGLRFVEVKRP